MILVGAAYLMDGNWNGAYLVGVGCILAWLGYEAVWEKSDRIPGSLGFAFLLAALFVGGA